MNSNTLLGHLTNRFTAHPEVVATEALSFILNKSHVITSTFLRFTETSGVNLSNFRKIVSQSHGDDGAIPDLAGIDNSGNEILSIELKFWAALTSNQPITYLKRLQVQKGKLLLFVAPFGRFVTLWSEIKRRCNSDIEQSIVKEWKIDEEYLILKLNSNITLALVSWSILLDNLQKSAQTVVDPSILSDLEQLHGLCSRMDEEAFLPFSSEELDPLNGKRIVQYFNIPIKVAEKLIERKIASQVSKFTGGYVYYGVTLEYKKFHFYLHFNAEQWSNHRNTPIWLQFSKTWGNNKAIKNSFLNYLEAQNPARLITAKKGSYFVPVFMKHETEIDEVIDDLLNQIKDILSYLD